MHIAIKLYVLPALIIICLLASWQGISVPPEGGNLVAAEISAPYLQTPGPVHIVSHTEPDISGSYPDVSVTDQPLKDNGQAFTERWLAERLPATDLLGIPGMEMPVIVAILDTGIETDHEDLGDKVIEEINLTDTEDVGDIHGHGTHIAGIITANADNGFGIDGIAPDCRLFNVKVADDKGRVRTSVLAEGIRWSVEHGADIINISIEIKEYSSLLEEAINYAWDKGVVVIAAAGNEGSDISVYPAGYENCISVTALQDEADLAPLANYGDWVDVAAPGYEIYSTLPCDKYGYKYGTSFAAAYISGLAAGLLPTAGDTNGDGKVNDEVRDQILSLCGFDIAN